MPELPHGWRMRNGAGEVEGPPLENEYSDSGSEEPFDIKPDSEGWDDVEDDSEPVSIQCLLSDEQFPSAKTMVEHCKDKLGFDFVEIQRQHKLDFYSSIKLVNYIRAEVKAGKERPDVSDPALWANDKYLQPTLEDDALLFGLDELDDSPVEDDADTNAGDEAKA